MQETFTTNANLAPSGQEQSSFVTSLTGSIAVAGTGPRVQLNGTAAVQGLLYTGQRQDNAVYPQVNLLGSVEAVERFFYVEAAVNVSQQYLSAFGPQPSGNIGATDNRYTSASVRLSPFIRGVLPGEMTYLLRNDSIWNNLGNTPDTAGFVGAYYNHWYGRLDSPIRTFGLSAELDTTYTKFTDETALTTELVRGYLYYQPDVQLRLFALGGYERNDYFTSESENAVYGGGAEWRPSERTAATGRWEQRFFGSSYLVAVDHRNPSWAFNINASRNVTTYAQQLLALPAGGNVAALVNAAFTTRIPDPAQRAAAVQEFLQANGLPATLQSPLNFYTQQVQRYDQQSATLVWFVGTRSALAFTAYNRKSEVISGGTGTALPPPFGQQNNNTQRGGAVTYSHRLTAFTSLNATVTRFNTIATAPFTGESTTNAAQVASVTRLSPKTDGFAGLTYTAFDSDVSTDYTVFTAFVGLNHRF